MKVFLSYSHEDAAALKRLHKHLSVLQRQKLIDEWYDRKILAGGIIDAEITQRLESSDLFLLLVSPDFLASDYCVDREMNRALERHKSGKAKVIPIILKHCDWKHMPLGALRALPRDGYPISKWADKDEAYHDVVKELRRVLGADHPQRSASTNKKETLHAPVQPSADRIRVRRDFNEIDRNKFREMALNVIRNYFHNGIKEIDAMDNLEGQLRSLSPTSFTCTIINNRKRVTPPAHITIHGGGGYMTLGDIYYSFSENAPTNSANGWFTIQSDDYNLFLYHTSMWPMNPDDRLTPEAAAEQLWVNYLENAEISVV